MDGRMDGWIDVSIAWDKPQPHEPAATGLRVPGMQWGLKSIKKHSSNQLCVTLFLGKPTGRKFMG